jgi:hypothetical protein
MPGWADMDTVEKIIVTIVGLLIATMILCSIYLSFFDTR